MFSRNAALSRGVCLCLVLLSSASNNVLMSSRLSLSDNLASVATNVRIIFLMTMMLLFTSNCEARISEKQVAGKNFKPRRDEATVQ